MDIYLRVVLALGAVLLLIGGVTWLARFFGVGTPLKANAPKNRRLRVEEVLALDNRRRLILIKKDQTELLLCVGGPSDFLVEGASDQSEAPSFVSQKKVI